MEGVRLYTSADAGAPVINGTDKGSLVRLLHACLVTGYGVKTAAGWTREWVKADESKAAFRNVAGSGRYLWVEPFTEAEEYPDLYPYSNYFIARLYDSLPEEERIDEFTACGDEKFCLSVSNDGTTRPWAIVANDKFFFLIIHIDATAIPEDNGFIRYAALFVGDPERPDGANAEKRCCICGSFCGFDDDGTGGGIGPVFPGLPGGPDQNAPQYGAHFGDGLKVCPTSYGYFGEDVWLHCEKPRIGGTHLGNGNFDTEYRKDIGLAAFRPALVSLYEGNFGNRTSTFIGFLPSCYAPLYPVVFPPLEQVAINGEGFVAMSWGVGELLFRMAR